MLLASCADLDVGPWPPAPSPVCPGHPAPTSNRDAACSVPRDAVGYVPGLAEGSAGDSPSNRYGGWYEPGHFGYSQTCCRPPSCVLRLALARLRREASSCRSSSATR